MESVRNAKKARESMCGVVTVCCGVVSTADSDSAVLVSASAGHDIERRMMKAARMELGAHVTHTLD